VTERPATLVSGFVLDAPDPQALAGFYEALLGWSRAWDDPTWVKLMPPDGRLPGLSFQLEPVHQRPAWPSTTDHQQMQAHLDVGVADLGPAVAYAEELGATQAEWQPQDDVRVMLDPVGHPFCLFLTDQL
jgi:hypothetical protein